MSKKVLNVDTIHTAAVVDDQHKFADEATQSVFGELAGSTKGYSDRKKWEEDIRVIEDEYMEATQSLNPDAKTKGKTKKDGTMVTRARWKYRTYLPAAWSSSKSVCGNALDHGITLDETSKKTATEQAIKEVKEVVKVDKTPKEKIHIAFETANKVLSGVGGTEREELCKDLKDLYGVDTTNGYWRV